MPLPTEPEVRHLLVVAGARDVTGMLREIQPELTITAMVATTRLAKVRRPRECARVIALDPAATTEEWVRLATAVHDAEPIHAVGAFGEYDQDRAAAIAVALGLRFHSPDVISAVYDKALMRRRLRDAEVEDVPCATVTGLDELRDFAAAHGCPLILKPYNGTGSRGVVKASRPDALAEDLARAVASAGGPDPVLLAERYLPGEEVSVEAFSEDGEHRVLGVTRKIIDDNFVELGHEVREPAPEDAALVAYVPRVLDALGIGDGPTHTELILTGDGPRVVETHTRAGGDQIPQLLSAASGVDMIELAVRQALGRRVMPMLDALLSADGRPASVGAIRYLVPPRSGRLMAVEDTAAATAIPYVTGCTVLKLPGDELVSPVRDSVDRVAYCTAVAADGGSAREAARRAVEALSVVVDAG